MSSSSRGETSSEEKEKDEVTTINTSTSSVAKQTILNDMASKFGGRTPVRVSIIRLDPLYL